MNKLATAFKFGTITLLLAAVVQCSSSVEQGSSKGATQGPVEGSSKGPAEGASQENPKGIPWQRGLAFRTATQENPMPRERSEIICSSCR